MVKEQGDQFNFYASFPEVNLICLKFFTLNMYYVQTVVFINVLTRSNENNRVKEQTGPLNFYASFPEVDLTNTAKLGASLIQWQSNSTNSEPNEKYE